MTRIPPFELSRTEMLLGNKNDGMLSLCIYFEIQVYILWIMYIVDITQTL